MLCRLNRAPLLRRRTFSALLAVLWLNLIVLPCVMAQPFSAQDCYACPEESGAGQAALPAQAGDCGDAMHCALMLDEHTLAKALPYAVTHPVMQPLWAESTLAGHSAFHLPSFYSTLTPLERLPILRI
jgi:hypothetical protein